MNKKLAAKLERGIILINKQPGRTSHDETALIRSALRKAGVVTKVGHSGTLDPKVTGLLVVGLGKGTRVLEYMLLSEKKYVGDIIFHDYVTRDQLEQAITKFTGAIEQLPPRKSSVKREVRTREVYSIEIKDFDYEGKKATLSCAVERGTYIRKLFHDMGQHIGVRAHMGDLHRTHVGTFSEELGVVTSDQCRKLLIKTKSINPFSRISAQKKLNDLTHPIEGATEMFAKVVLYPGVERHIGSGSDVYVPGVHTVSEEVLCGDTVGVYTDAGLLVALGVAGMSGLEIMNTEKGIAVVTKKVLI